MLLERLLAELDKIQRPLDLEHANPWQVRAIEAADRAALEGLECYAALRRCPPLAPRFDQLDEGVITPWELVQHAVGDLADWRMGTRWELDTRTGQRVYTYNPELAITYVGGA